jgi:hypothetical protein
MKEFLFEGKTYRVAQKAYDDGVIILPDGRLLMVRHWTKIKNAGRPDDLILLGANLTQATAAPAA